MAMRDSLCQYYVLTLSLTRRTALCLGSVEKCGIQRRFVAVSPVNPIRPLSISLSLSLLSIQLHHAGRRLLDAAAKVAGTPDQ